MQILYFIRISIFILSTVGLSAQIPQLTFAKRMGGIGAEGASAMAVDTFGNVYTTGTFSGTSDFDPGPGIFNLNAPIFGIFVSKLDANGNFKWAKNLGIGNGLGICVDHDGNVYTTGRFTGTSDFDPGAGTFNLTSVGNTDIFISKLDSLGNFRWAKSMGGTNEDVANDIAFHDSGLLGLTGNFRGSADFDPGTGSFNMLADFIDVFVCVLDTAANFQWTIKLGGGKGEDAVTGSVGNAIKFVGEAQVVTTGYFSGTGVFGNQSLSSFGTRDIFITKLGREGDVIWTKQMGGTANDQANDIAVDSKGDIYTTGVFVGLADFNPDMVTFDMTAVQGDIFISKLNADGDFIFAKQLGGDFSDVAQGIFVDDEYNIYTTGSYFQAADFDPGPEIFELSVVGNNNADIFISKLDEKGDFVYAIKFGGLQHDEGTSIYVDKDGSIYSAGSFFGFVDFDPSESTEHLTSAGVTDIYVNKLCQITTPVIVGPEGFCSGESITLTTMQADSYLWSNGDTTQTIIVNEPGDYSLTISNQSGCSAVSATQSIEAFPIPDQPSIFSNGGSSICKGDTLLLSTEVFSQYNWSTGDTTQQIIVIEQGDFTLTVTNEFGCEAISDDFFVEVLPVPELIFSPATYSICEGDSFLLSVNIPAESYLWSTGESTQSIIITDSGDYSVEVTFGSGCSTESNIIIVTVNPLPVVDLGDDINLVSGDSVIVDAGTGSELYEWSTGSISQTITVNSMGEYCVTVTNIFGCSASDCLTVSVVTSSNDENTAYKISVSPNPSQDVIYIQSENFAISSLQLINIEGKTVLSEFKFSNAGELREMHIESLSPGLYYLYVRGEGVLRTIPVIKK
ncbi:MAG: SBBP repeat-containing protein [Saprospiraceae bacterium]|nr:SBBP repeat-containing protein [Saprospiraceae bacterium]